MVVVNYTEYRYDKKQWLATQIHLGCNKGEANNDKQQLPDYNYIAACEQNLWYQTQAKN